jgi:uncharacterized protein
VPLSPLLLSVVACPVDHGSLVPVPGGLLNPRLHRLYPIVDDVPVLLADEAKRLNAEEAASLLAQAR